ncbi:MAG: hypothetical protein ACETWQ_15470, partial [Phycisphaerae bacterium]
ALANSAMKSCRCLLVRPLTTIFNKANTAGTIPLYFKKVLIAVEWLGPRLSEHWFDHPGQF